MKLIDHISQDKLDELVEAGYITEEQSRQMLQDAYDAFKAAQVKKELKHMTFQDWDRLMRQRPKGGKG